MVLSDGQIYDPSYGIGPTADLFDYSDLIHAGYALAEVETIGEDEILRVRKAQSGFMFH